MARANKNDTIVTCFSSVTEIFIFLFFIIFLLLSGVVVGWIM